MAGYLYYKSEFMTLSSQCANAMDESWFVDQSKNESIKKSSQINLLTCHEYDKTRKRMLISGVSENALAYLGLRALELHQRSAEEFVELHRFPTR